MNVLLVEDDPVVGGIMAQWLERRGHSVCTTTGIDSAWAAFETETYPLLVVDVMLDQDCGYDLCSRVRAHPEGWDCIILVVTVRNSSTDLRKALDAGADDFIPKPVNADVFDLRMTIAEERVKSRRERREHARALLQSEERFHELVNHIHEVFWIASPDRQEISYISPAVREVWGAAPADVRRNPGVMTSAIHPDDRARVSRMYPISGRSRMVSGEYRLQSASGGTRYIRERAFPIRDEEGGIVRLVGVSEDVTETRQAEEDTRKAQRHQIEMAQRTSHLTSLGMLAAGVAHEVNNPLQGMMSHLRLARRTVPADSEAAASLDMVERGIRTVADLVEKMLVLGRAPNRQDEVSCCSDSIQFVLQLLSGRLKKRNITVEKSGAGERSRLGMQIARSELTQVLVNLVVNACDAMPDGGTIRITCDQSGGYGVIRVSDTGYGIEPDQLDHVFSPFYTSKGAMGTGLGLSISESIVRQCNGQIDVTSELGQGTEFVVRLPLVEAGARMQEAGSVE